MTSEEIGAYIEKIQREQIESSRRDRECMRAYEEAKMHLRLIWMKYEWEMTMAMYGVLAGVLRDPEQKERGRDAE